MKRYRTATPSRLMHDCYPYAKPLGRSRGTIIIPIKEQLQRKNKNLELFLKLEFIFFDPLWKRGSRSASSNTTNFKFYHKPNPQLYTNLYFKPIPSAFHLYLYPSDLQVPNLSPSLS